jgi:hypothetical protein
MHQMNELLDAKHILDNVTPLWHYVLVSVILGFCLGVVVGALI